MIHRAKTSRHITPTTKSKIIHLGPACLTMKTDEEHPEHTNVTFYLIIVSYNDNNKYIPYLILILNS